LLIPREAWCSEAVSYWHREAGIPYPGGYRNSTSILDWRLDTTYAIQTFYEAEELFGGRGRWIDWDDLDYNDFQPGENAPVPGAYVLIRRYDPDQGIWNGGSHSMMIDEMTVYRTLSGRVTRVEVTILEGNSGDKVRDDRVLEDLLELTPAGSEWIGTDRKIVGFGVDLDSRGRPVYTRGKLRWVTVPEIRLSRRKYPRVHDPVWEGHFAAVAVELARYAKLVRRGPTVKGQGFDPRGIPDGKKAWTFPTEGGAAEVDLLSVHPLPIKGLILVWEGYIPTGVEVEWAGADRRFRTVPVPDLKEFRDFQGAFPFPVIFGKSGVKVRYVRIRLPAQGRKAVLRELRFVYDWGRWRESEADF